MTKEEFNQYTGELHCKTCNKKVPKIHMDYRKVHKNGEVAKCNVCEWIKRHDGIPIIEGFSEDEIIKTLHFFIYEESKYINDLATKIDRTLEDSIELYQSLKIGNKKCLVKSNCEYCGKEIENVPNVYKLNKNLYCSKKCYWNDKPNKIEHGELNSCYNRIITTCTNCEKEIKVIPYDYNKTNMFGDNHNFCSQECYWEYRSKYYVDEKAAMYNHIYTDEQLNKLRITALKNSRSAKRFDSNIQLKINNILDKNNIKYEREYIIKYYAVDNYLLDYNLIIEVMGDYWHTNPLKYNDNMYKINKIQQNGLLHDKQKHTYIKNNNNIEILYLWETDINNRYELCEKLILEYIKKEGILKNYHSFNWDYKEDSLFLCNNIIIPYQNMHSNEYKHLFVKNIS